MPDPEFLAALDDAHRALGRYVAEFSRLTYSMRSVMVQRLRRPDDPFEIAEMTLGAAPAQQIADAFFGMCGMVGSHDQEETKVAVRLRSDVQAQIQFRNDVAHGDWWIGWGNEEGMRAPYLGRMKPGRTKGPQADKEIPVPKLDAESDLLAGLRVHIVEFGWVSLGVHPLYKVGDVETFRVSDFLSVRDKRVVRVGRLSDRFGPPQVP